jgi:MFS family permease
MHQTFEVVPPRVPWLIKRNTVLVALSQCFTGAGMSMGFGLGPLMVIALTGSAALAGLSVALFGLSRFIVAYPVGKISDAYGRKPGILLGLGIAMAGSLCLWAAMAAASAVLLMLGLLLFGMGMHAAQQMRVAATDMFPPSMRAQALGYVALGSLVGLIVMPGLVSGGEILAHRSGGDALGTPWLLLPMLILPGMAIITQVRPDPKDIGARLADYYPGHLPVLRPAGTPTGDFSARALLRDAQLRLAIVSNCAGQGNMSIVMVLTSLVLHHHGHSLTAIAISHTLHSIGMFGFTVPLGQLADRYGREWVMYPGVATTLVGAWLVTFTEGFVPITLGTFLVGLGWAGANVAATALVADRYESAERGRAIGVADSFAGGVSVVAALVTGPLIDWSLPAAGLAAVLIAAVPLAMRVVTRVADRATSASAR